MGIKLGNIDAKYIKLGVADCSIYLGDTLLYPQSKPQPIVRYAVTDDISTSYRRYFL